MASAVPGIQRSARYQLPEDEPLWAHLLDREREDRILRPNLYLLTGPRVAPEEGEHGTWIAMLMVKSG